MAVWKQNNVRLGRGGREHEGTPPPPKTEEDRRKIGIRLIRSRYERHRAAGHRAEA